MTQQYTQNKASALKLRGYVKNTHYGTVVGNLEGNRLQIDMMLVVIFFMYQFIKNHNLFLWIYNIRKDWLKRTGSPKSRIDGVDFKAPKAIPDFTYQDFKIIQ